MFGLRPIHFAIIGGLLAVVLTAGGFMWVFSEGKSAGAGKVTTAVQTETIKAGETARIKREKADEDVRATPYGDRADGLR